MKGFEEASIDVTEELAPWYKMKGSPKRVIAALELLATLIAVKLWGGRIGGRSKAKVKAFTDNKGNSFMLSTKFPLTIMLMELSEELRQGDKRVSGSDETPMSKLMI